MPTLETERLILRSFRDEDVDVMAQLFANPDFMRFSLGVFTERKQTVAFIEKVIGWDRAGHTVAVCRRSTWRGRDCRLLRFFSSR
jgi:RimJ/RimL family protein N-acetyltransferase